MPFIPSATDQQTIDAVTAERLDLENKMNTLIATIGKIPIASPKIMPFGWRKAAKGRTVWRIIEEIISQNLEHRAQKLGLESVKSADSEVGVYDFEFKYPDGDSAYVNIKSSVLGGRKNKDDISKASGIRQFFAEKPQANLYIATFVLEFNADMTISIVSCVVMPTAWIPDIYVNPSNNGNLQSAEAKYLDKAVPRSNQQFLTLLDAEIANAQAKRSAKLAAHQ